jgi:phosphomannomutase
MTLRNEHDLRARVERWLADDPDPTTRDELSELLRTERWDELRDRFGGRLEFGTAGLRGVLGAGPNRMNRAVVRAATAGLCAYLEQTTPDARARGIVVGYDGRRGSLEFAKETAEVAAGRGFLVHLFDRMIPTPICAFACKQLHAAAGVMITASHNPPEYNGYKVYWGNGAQIIPPHDEGISKAIEACGPLAEMTLVPLAEARARGLVRMLGNEIEDTYHAAIQTLRVTPETRPEVRVAYTALHGVGDRHVRRALESAGFRDVHHVKEQAEPDGRFPTVRFPNPEEPGAMDAVIVLARTKDAELVLANDPDADRLAVAVRRAPGEYVQLTGNEVGCLLAHYLLEHGDENTDRLVISSIVSSPMCGAIATAHGARWEQTLTGFKWIANRAMELEAERGYRFVFGYEEALGYTVGSVVRDKDGVSAALLVADMAAWCKHRGRTLLDELEICARRYGLFLSRQVSVTMKGRDGAERIEAIMDRVRAHPPDAIGAHPVLAIQDLLRRERRVRGGRVEATTLPPSNAIVLELEGGHRVMLRPSGTEPKIKYYFDLRVPIGESEPVASARARGERVLEALVDAFLAFVAPNVS